VELIPSSSAPMNHSNLYQSISLSELRPPSSSTKSFQRIQMKKINLCNSLGTQLYLLTILTLIGMLIAMIITILLLQQDGVLWMSNSSDDLLNTAIINLQGIAAAKAQFVKVRQRFLVS
jgi:hypothetical protein